MEQFTEEHSKLLLSKEWLAKSDSQTSTPYLFKFCSNTVDLSCCVLLTDTKSVWTEVLTSQQFARRWRYCNPTSATPDTETSEEDVWRTETLKLLSRAHTLGAVSDVSFKIVQSTIADLAFELQYETFKWRWETCFLGHKACADIISKHLIFPLLSLNHLAFSSPQAITELSDVDVEKASDKLGRTARRSVDTHIKNALSKPRMASTLRRMTAMFNFIPELPPVISTAEKPDLIPHFVRPEPALEKVTLKTVHAVEVIMQPDVQPSHVENKGSLRPPIGNDNSATEESEGDDNDMYEEMPRGQSKPTSGVSASNHTTLVSPMAPNESKDNPDSDSSSPRPAKKFKQKVSASSSDDSEEDHKDRMTQLKSGPAGKRGTRQPIKRGGKRF